MLSTRSTAGADCAARHPWRVIGAWLVLVVVVIAASGAFGRKLEDSFEVPGTGLPAGRGAAHRAAVGRGGVTAHVVLTPQDAGATLASARCREPRLAARACRGGGAAARARRRRSPRLSPDGRVALVERAVPRRRAARPGPTCERPQGVRRRRPRAGSPLQIEMRRRPVLRVRGGSDGARRGRSASSRRSSSCCWPSARSSRWGCRSAWRSSGWPRGRLAVAARLPGRRSRAGRRCSAAMVGLGVGIDYALFLVTRHREYLARGLTVEEAVGRALATAGQAVVFAGGTVVVAILGLAVAGIPFMTAGGIAISVIVLVMVLASVTLLPAFLGVAGPWINRLGVHRSSAHRRGVPSTALGPVGRTTSPATRGVRRRRSRAAARRWPHPFWRCTSASPTTARCPSRAPSAAPTTWSPTGSAPAPTGRS